MKNSPFTQNIIALIWDFDKTLISSYMQEPLFEKYNIDSKTFWTEVNSLSAYYKKQNIHINEDTSYLNHILTYVKYGKMKGLSNQILFDCGKELNFYPGLPGFFKEIKNLIEANPKYKSFDIHLEHYVVSTGFAETIKGSLIAKEVDGIFGCEFIESPAIPGYLNAKENTESTEHQEISQIAIALDNTSKTRFLFEINKGCNKYPDEINVNASMPEENRRIPFENMIYIADGPSDVPAFSILNSHGGSTFAIYPHGDLKAFNQTENLRKAGRVETFGEADYRTNSHTWMWLTSRVEQIANKITERLEANIKNSSSAPPTHLN